ncbi:MAG TPA: histidine kinase dimerization/phosphoacceptor domain -containing protein [Spirochaetales bacterium]|nr:histidine kinase dimerization/phosphoacceptor domain -containing protein [Spirochaetales bacterium]
MERFPASIVVIEDERAHAELVNRAFERWTPRHEVRIAHSLAEADSLLAAGPADLVLADWKVPDGSGIEFAREGRSLGAPVVIMTSFGSEARAVEAMKAGALDYVVKSDSTFADLPHIVERSLREWDRIESVRRAEEALRESERRARSILEASLREKEVLLGEIHHRVKNNMQLIESLLMLQLRKLGTGEARQPFHDAMNRVHAMARTHEALCDSGDLERIDLGELVRSLSGDLVQSEGLSTRIRLEYRLEPVIVGADRAIPCGVIVNELMSNALKHAYTDGRGSGTIRFEVGADGDGRAYLSVSDDGVGMEGGPERDGQGGIGLPLVETLSAQVKGALEMEAKKGKGTKVTVRFPII